MADMKDRIDNLIAELKQERDELRVRMNLAKLEATEEWHEIEQKIVKLEGKAKEVGAATAEASKDVGAAARLLGDEIRKGLKSIARKL